MSGRTNEADVQPGYMKEAVDYPGMLLTLVAASTITTAPEYDLTDAGDEPHGYAFNTTKDPVTLIAGAAVIRGVVALIEGQEAEFVLLATNAAIAIGDELETAAQGTVDLKSGAGWCVGTALQAAAQNAGATAATRYIRVRVSKRYAAA